MLLDALHLTRKVQAKEEFNLARKLDFMFWNPGPEKFLYYSNREQVNISIASMLIGSSCIQSSKICLKLFLYQMKSLLCLFLL